MTESSSALTKALGLLKKQGEKKFDAVLDLDEKKMKEPLPHISTKSIIIDNLIGGIPNQWGVRPCPGLPKGKIIQLYGWQSSGKTTLALSSAASVCEEGGAVMYFDYENEVAPDYAAALGVPISDPDRFLLLQPATLEDGLRYMVAGIQAGVGLIIIDSVGAAVPEEAFTDTLTNDGRIGNSAANWGRALKKLKGMISRTGTCILGISQLRANINAMGYGDKTTVQGGNAWKFYSAVRIKLQPISHVKGKVFNLLKNKYEKQVIAAKVRAKLDKCKVSSSQKHEAEYYLKWGIGIDDFRSVVDIATAHKIIAKGGAWLTWTDIDGNEHKAQGVERLRELVCSDAELQDKLYKQTFARLDEIATQRRDILDDEADEDDVTDEDLDSLDL